MRIEYPSSEALAVEKKPNWVKPRRFGLPWTRYELQNVACALAKGYPLTKIVEGMERPASGILAKLVALKFLEQDVSSRAYFFQPLGSLSGLDAAKRLYAAMKLDTNSPFYKHDLGDLKSYYISQMALQQATLHFLAETGPYSDTAAGTVIQSGNPTTVITTDGTSYGVGNWATTASTLVGISQPLGIVGSSLPLGNLTVSNSSTTSLKVNNMSQITVDPTVAVQSLDIVFGKDAKDMSDADFLAAIRKLEDQIADLGKIKASSKKVKDKIAELSANLIKVVDLYDSL